MAQLPWSSILWKSQGESNLLFYYGSSDHLLIVICINERTEMCSIYKGQPWLKSSDLKTYT